MTIKQYDLIIFDCDGTLVDSEYLHNKINSDILISVGLPEYTPEKSIEDFSGSSWREIKKEIYARHSVEVPDTLIEARNPKTLKAMDTDLKSIEGALDFVKFVKPHCKIAVGSNGEPAGVLKSLQILGFMDYFDEAHLYTKEDVENAKPAPDLFLYAAKQMGVEPSRCLVIEDSHFGARAGVAAGMDVFGFTGVSHDKKRSESQLQEAGVTQIFDDFIHMAEVLKL